MSWKHKQQHKEVGRQPSGFNLCDHLMILSSTVLVNVSMSSLSTPHSNVCSVTYSHFHLTFSLLVSGCLLVCIQDERPGWRWRWEEPEEVSEASKRLCFGFHPVLICALQQWEIASHFPVTHFNLWFFLPIIIALTFTTSFARESNPGSRRMQSQPAKVQALT